MSEVEKADQAEQSVEDQIASKFIDINEEPQEAEENVQVEGNDEEQEAAPPEEVEVEVNGERFKIPKQLEKAIMQERDYTRKTQELSEQRKLIEHEKKAARIVKLERDFEQSVAPEMGQIQALDNYIRHLRSVDVRSLSMDDQIAHLAELQRVPAQRNDVQQGIEAKRQKFMQDAEVQIGELKKSASELLSKQIPGFSDEVVTAIKSYAVKSGYTEQDADFIMTDPKSSSVLWKAMRFDQLQATKGDAVKKAAPVVKSGASNPMPNAVRDKLNLRKSLKSATNSQAKAKLIEQYLAR